MGRTIIVSRHDAAIEFARQAGFDGEVMASLEPETIATLKRDDRVVGPLPLALIAELCARGVRYYAIDIAVPIAKRGAELTSDEMRSAGARIQRYTAYKSADALQAAPPKKTEPIPERGSSLWGVLRTAILVVAAAALLRIGFLVIEAFASLLGALGASALDRPTAGEFWERLMAPFGTTNPLLALVGAVVWILVFLGAVAVTRVLGGRILHAQLHRAPIEPKRALIQPLSLLRPEQLSQCAAFEAFPLQVAILGNEDIEQSIIACDNALRDKPNEPSLLAARAELLRFADVIGTGNLPWQQNLRAIHAHLERLEALVVLPSSDGSDLQCDRFVEMVTTILRRSGAATITIRRNTGLPVDYEDDNAVYRAIRTEIASLRRQRIPEREIAVDITPGQKPLTMGAAIAALNSKVVVTYVNLEGVPVSYDGRVELTDDA
jgi:CRISPR-associated protein Csx16